MLSVSGGLGRGSGSSALVLMQEILNIYICSSSAQHQSCSPRLWGQGVVTKLPPSSIPPASPPPQLRGSLLDPKLLLGLLVLAVNLEGLGLGCDR